MCLFFIAQLQLQLHHLQQNLFSILNITNHMKYNEQLTILTLTVNVLDF